MCDLNRILNKLLLSYTWIVIVLCCLYGANGYTQSLNYGFGIQPRYGFLIAHRATMGHLPVEHVRGIELSTTIQTNGEKQWHHDFLFPKITFSAIYTSMGNKEVLGDAFGVSGGLYLPFFKEKGWSLGTNLNAGLAYVTKKYDLERNPKNNAIGSHLNCLVSVGIMLEKIFDQHSLNFEVNMTHLSNGAVQLPNLGANLPVVKLGYFYYLNPIKQREEAVYEREGQGINTWKFYSQLIFSLKEIYPTGGRKYGVVGLTNYVNYRVTNKFIAEGGVDVLYNSSTIPYNGGGYPAYKNLQAGVYAAYVLPIHRFYIVVGMGRYLYKPLLPEGMWYHKLGGRFRITEKIWGNVTIKSHWAKADYFEYGISYRW